MIHNYYVCTYYNLTVAYDSQMHIYFWGDRRTNVKGMVRSFRLDSVNLLDLEVAVSRVRVNNVQHYLDSRKLPLICFQWFYSFSIIFPRRFRFRGLFFLPQHPTTPLSLFATPGFSPHSRFSTVCCRKANVGMREEIIWISAYEGKGREEGGIRYNNEQY